MDYMIKSLKNTYRLCDYVKVEGTSVNSKSYNQMEKANLAQIPDRGIYTLHHPDFGWIYLGISNGAKDPNESGIVNRWKTHAGKLTGNVREITGKGPQDTVEYKRLRTEAVAKGMDLIEDLYKKVTIKVIPMKQKVNDIEKAEGVLIGRYPGNWRCNTSKTKIFNDLQLSVFDEIYSTKGRLDKIEDNLSSNEKKLDTILELLKTNKKEIDFDTIKAMKEVA